MSPTSVTCLTPAGSAAIAVIAVCGPRAWDIIRRLFRPASGHALPDQPGALSTWFGRIAVGADDAGDEVVVAVISTEPEPQIEIHCHGGRQIVRLLLDRFEREGCLRTKWRKLFPIP